MGSVMVRLYLPRTVVHVVYDSFDGLWYSKLAGQVVDAACTKKQVLLRTRRRLRANWELFGIRGQMVVHNMHEGIAYENTYGLDPRESPG